MLPLFVVAIEHSLPTQRRCTLINTPSQYTLAVHPSSTAQHQKIIFT